MQLNTQQKAELLKATLDKATALASQLEHFTSFIQHWLAHESINMENKRLASRTTDQLVQDFSHTLLAGEYKITELYMRYVTYTGNKTHLTSAHFSRKLKENLGNKVQKVRRSNGKTFITIS